jgi:hypothetical protein
VIVTGDLDLVRDPAGKITVNPRPESGPPPLVVTGTLTTYYLFGDLHQQVWGDQIPLAAGSPYQNEGVLVFGAPKVRFPLRAGDAFQTVLYAQYGDDYNAFALPLYGTVGRDGRITGSVLAYLDAFGGQIVDGTFILE